MDMDQPQVDISNLNDSDKQELNRFLVSESQRAQIQSSVHHLSDLCFKKCITGTISSGRLDKTEDSCAQNCVDRWMDTQMSILKHLEKLRGQ